MFSDFSEIFKDNKRILLFLIEEQIMIIDEYIVSRITWNEFNFMYYFEYFLLEIKRFLTKEVFQNHLLKNSTSKNEEFIGNIKKKFGQSFSSSPLFD